MTITTIPPIPTDGRRTAMSSRVRRQPAVPPADVHEVLLDLVSRVRDEARLQLGTSEHSGWELVIDDFLVDLVVAGNVDAARERLRDSLGLGRRAEPRATAG